MKITKVTPIFCDGGTRALTFVKVETDEGITGYGECTDNRASFGIGGCVRDLTPLLVGKNPLMVEKLYSNMSIHFQQSPGGFAQKAIAGIEIALWDIKGKAMGVPLYDLWGGPLRDKIRVYWSHCGTYRARNPEYYPKSPPIKSLDDIYNLGKEVVQRGYTAFKTNIITFAGPPRSIRSFDQNIDFATLKAIDNLMSTFRKAVGDDVDIEILLDAPCPLVLGGAVAGEVGRLGPFEVHHVDGHRLVELRHPVVGTFDPLAEIDPGHRAA